MQIKSWIHHELIQTQLTPQHKFVIQKLRKWIIKLFEQQINHICGFIIDLYGLSKSARTDQRDLNEEKMWLKKHNISIYCSRMECVVSFWASIPCAAMPRRRIDNITWQFMHSSMFSIVIIFIIIILKKLFYKKYF
jgi:hypothetical protein